MEIPKTKEVKYGYACPDCLAILAASLDPWPKNITVICSECDACFNSDNAARKVQDIELEEPEISPLPKRSYYMMVRCPPKCQMGHREVHFNRGAYTALWECKYCQKVQELTRPGYHPTEQGCFAEDSTPCPFCPECDEGVTVQEGDDCWVCTNPSCTNRFISSVEEPKRDPIEYNPRLNSSWFYVSGGSEIWYNGKDLVHIHEDSPFPRTPKTHDSIYKQIEDRCGVSHSALAEDIIQRDIPRVPQLYLALASKYMVRVGCKEEWEKDAGKLLNYVHKAATGKWFNEGGSDDSE